MPAIFNYMLNALLQAWNEVFGLRLTLHIAGIKWIFSQNFQYMPAILDLEILRKHYKLSKKERLNLLEKYKGIEITKF